jgi:hypothetical protein
VSSHESHPNYIPERGGVIEEGVMHAELAALEDDAPALTPQQMKDMEDMFRTISDKNNQRGAKYYLGKISRTLLK